MAQYGSGSLGGFGGDGSSRRSPWPSRTAAPRPSSITRIRGAQHMSWALGEVSWVHEVGRLLFQPRSNSDALKVPRQEHGRRVVDSRCPEARTGRLWLRRGRRVGRYHPSARARSGRRRAANSSHAQTDIRSFLAQRRSLVVRIVESYSRTAGGKNHVPPVGVDRSSPSFSNLSSPLISLMAAAYPSRAIPRTRFLVPRYMRNNTMARITGFMRNQTWSLAL